MPEMPREKMLHKSVALARGEYASCRLRAIRWAELELGHGPVWARVAED